MEHESQLLLSLPPVMALEVAEFEPEFVRCGGFAASDPVGSQFGSGGGAAHLLVEAWRSSEGSLSFIDWLRHSRKLLIHAGGQSRRLPAYAAVGKAFIPLPAWRWSVGQRLGQKLLDLQLPFYRDILRRAPSGTAALLASGDVLLRASGSWSTLPEADVLAFGLWIRPELAQHFGVLFCPRQRPDHLAFCLQKPEPERTRELATDHLFMLDTGVWLLSERAVLTLLRKCGWDDGRQRFKRELPASYEFYAGLTLALGESPSQRDPEINQLTCAVVPIPQGEFYHFGTSRDLIESTTALHNLVIDQTRTGYLAAKPHPDQHTLNSPIAASLGPDQRALWIENSCLPSSWHLTHDHVLTGVPDNDWSVQLEPGICLDFVPIGESALCVRAYGIDDTFRDATWFGRPASHWFADRGIDTQAAGVGLQGDWHRAPLFPLLAPGELDGQWLEWSFAKRPTPNPDFSRRWLEARRLSAQQLSEQINLRRLQAQRSTYLDRVLASMVNNRARSIFFRLDLSDTAERFAGTQLPLPPPISETATVDSLTRLHDHMFRAAVLRRRNVAHWEDHETEAFSWLRRLLLQQTKLRLAQPTCQVQEDQIVWGRSPVRLDLAGGWTDTPPYCLEHGGRVVNLAVDLNGQPPIQVFARLAESPEIVIRSIDLGLEERVRTYEDLAGYCQVGSGFAIAKAALALAGFLPQFRQGRSFDSLEAQLRQFGGGLDVAVLCAVPKGSGLGTSSILASTMLGTLSELGGLNWTQHDLIQRTLALEQMLTTGGGWQDQAGGLFRGIKLIETEPGLEQKPTVRWLPETFFAAAPSDPRVFLYYTGLTRVAKGILKEIVRGIFLNSQTHLAIVGEIGENAQYVSDALQRNDWDGLCAAVRRSWDLNLRLDPGTNPPAVQAIFQQIGDYLAAAKLLGAGGGGYLLMLAKDEDAARRVRQSLTANPGNSKARFVDLGVSPTGFQVTRS